MQLAEIVSADEDVYASPSHLYLATNPGMREAIADADLNAEDMREVAEEAMSLMGLSEALYPDDVIIKEHEVVSKRDAAVPEQFFHVDAPANNFCGVLLIGTKGHDPNTVPETQMVDNQSMVEQIDSFTKDGPLQDRLDDIVVVRPCISVTDEAAKWKEYPRHVLTRLAEVPFRELLTDDQLEHTDRATEGLANGSRYTGTVFIADLMNDSIIDGSPLATCGIGSREIRLSLHGDQTDAETLALESLHEKITKYLLGSSVLYEAQKIVEGSALYIPVNQLHRAEPYNPRQHERSVVLVKCYSIDPQLAPPTRQKASGMEY